MKVSDFLKNNISENEKESLETAVILENIQRSKLLAIVIIGFEAVLLFVDILTSTLKVDDRFSFNAYFVMYSVMILLNAAYLLYLKSIGGKSDAFVMRKKPAAIAIVLYITLMMSWGSIVSLMDQRLYGHLMTFMVNMIVCSVIYLLDNRKILIPYFISMLIIAIGLPYFQNSSDVLIGHYVNLSVFIFISWLTSRILYRSYCENFTGKILLNEANSLLEKEIEENRKINAKLTSANKQLRELSLMDELTGIPNRRCFREFIESAFQHYVKEGSTISVIMIDIDFFKQFNDNYGHQDGDKTLIAIATQINSIIKDSGEILVRWGGEEFIYAALNRDEAAIEETAKTIMSKVSDLKIIHNDSPINPFITVSLGSCTVDITEKRDISKAIKFADSALYLAKCSGRNCVKTFNAGAAE